MTTAAIHCPSCGSLLVIARKGATSYCVRCDRWSGPRLRPRDWQDLARSGEKRGVLR